VLTTTTTTTTTTTIATVNAPGHNRILLTAPTSCRCRGPAAARLAAAALRGSGDHDTPLHAGRVGGHAE
jgi:hypothetical protein